MKPIVQRIFTKLAENKIELGMIQDGQSSARELSAIANELKGIKKEISRDIKRIDGYASDGMQQFKYLQKVTNDIEKINKEMGISTSIPELKAMEKAMDDFSEANKLKI